MEDDRVLIDMLKQNPVFKQLPVEKKEVFARLAEQFEDNDFALYLSPKELSEKLPVGSKLNWQEFLNLEVVRQYINGQMAQIAQVASRKTFQSLVSEGASGNVSAVKQINEVAGILNAGERNKIIVLHQISRPKIVREEAAK